MNFLLLNDLSGDEWNKIAGVESSFDRKGTMTVGNQGPIEMKK